MKKHKQALQAASSVTIHWLEALKNWKFRLLQGNYWKHSQWVLFFINYTHTILPIHNWTKWTFNSLFYTLFLITMNIKKFWNFTFVCQYNSNRYWFNHVCNMFDKNNRELTSARCHYINRTREPRTYASVISQAMRNYRNEKIENAIYNYKRSINWWRLPNWKKAELAAEFDNSEEWIELQKAREEFKNHHSY